MNYKYLLFILIGIIIFLLWNNSENFSVGNQFSLYNKPCTCSDEFNIPFQSSDDCIYIDDDEVFAATGERGLRRYGQYRIPCEWSGNSDLITTLQVGDISHLYLNDTQERFSQCRAQYTNGGMCALVNGIEYYCYLVGVPVNDSDIDYMVELNIDNSDNFRIIPGDNQQNNKIFESLCKIFLKSEGISILKRDKLLPVLAFNYDFTELLENKYYICAWFSTRSSTTSAHQLSIYYFMKNGKHKIVILDTYSANGFMMYGLENTMLEMDDLSLAPMKIMVFYLKFKPFLLVSNDIIFMRNGVILDTGTEILCKVIDTSELLVLSDSRLDSNRVFALARNTRFKVIERLDVGNKIRMRVTSYFYDGDEVDLNGWVTLTIDNSDNFKFIPDDYFTNSDYDEGIIQLVTYQVRFQNFSTCEKVFRDRDATRINHSYMDHEYLRIARPLQTNPLFKINDKVRVDIRENYLLLSTLTTMGANIKVYFGDFALSSFRCDSFTLPGSFASIGNNNFSIKISRYTHVVLLTFSSQNTYEFYYDLLTLNFNVPNTTRDLLKVQKMYASIEIYEEYLTDNHKLHDSTTACAVLQDAG